MRLDRHFFIRLTVSSLVFCIFVSSAYAEPPGKGGWEQYQGFVMILCIVGLIFLYRRRSKRKVFFVRSSVPKGVIKESK
jgi:hypothetical protein